MGFLRKNNSDWLWGRCFDEIRCKALEAARPPMRSRAALFQKSQSEKIMLARSLHPYERLLSTPEHCQRIERIARKQTQGAAIAWEDAAQIAQIKILQGLRDGKFRYGEADEFYRWATTVARFAIIDLVRKEKSCPYSSLDTTLPGTNMTILETIPDQVDTATALEHADLVTQAIAAITTLDHQYPSRGYLILWQGQVQGKKQIQIAIDMGISQGQVSQRWRELVGRVAEVLDLVSIDLIHREQAAVRQRAVPRDRSPLQW
jgi:RNA polymerase sigma factor (sigma-70 family)